MNIIQHPSPNYDARERGVDILMLHYTGMRTGAEALARLCDEAAGVSAHYVVEEDGQIFALVDEDKRAWHAGVSHWRGQTGSNHSSIGIEIVNPGHEFGYRPFPEIQMQSVIALSKEILLRHNIPARNVIGHSDVAPDRKEDPGELFDWAWLAREGIGLFPHPSPFPEGEGTYLEKLEKYGYDIEAKHVVRAFQRHFTPKAVTGEWNAECEAMLDALLKVAL